MKRILIISLLILLIPLVAIPADDIAKIGENIVEITLSKTETDVTGRSVEVWDERSTKHYGQDRIDRELTDAQQDFTKAQAIDCPAYKQNIIDETQARIDRLNAIQVKMDGAISTP